MCLLTYVVDTGAGSNLIRSDKLDPSRESNIQRREIPYLYSADNFSHKVAVAIMLYLKVGETRTELYSEWLSNCWYQCCLANVYLQIQQVDLPCRTEVVPNNSPTVSTLMVYKNDVSTDNTPSREERIRPIKTASNAGELPRIAQRISKNNYNKQVGLLLFFSEEDSRTSSDQYFVNGDSSKQAVYAVDKIVCHEGKETTIKYIVRW